MIHCCEVKDMKELNLQLWELQKKKTRFKIISIQEAYKGYIVFFETEE